MIQGESKGNGTSHPMSTKYGPGYTGCVQKLYEATGILFYILAAKTFCFPMAGQVDCVNTCSRKTADL
jgi:hypothetical protein